MIVILFESRSDPVGNYIWLHGLYCRNVLNTTSLITVTSISINSVILQPPISGTIHRTTTSKLYNRISHGCSTTGIRGGRCVCICLDLYNRETYMCKYNFTNMKKVSTRMLRLVLRETYVVIYNSEAFIYTCTKT